MLKFNNYKPSLAIIPILIIGLFFQHINFDLSIENNGLIEILLSDIGEATEPLKFKFNIDSELQPNAPFTQVSSEE